MDISALQKSTPKQLQELGQTYLDQGHDTQKEKAKKWGYEGMPAGTPATLTPPAASVVPAEFFPSRAFLTPSPKVPETCPPEKHQWVAQVFEMILKQFHDLDLCQSSSSLFLVYAHNHNRLGKADAEVSQRVIQWLSNLRSNLQSDRSASGHQALPLPATPEDKAKANDILSSQLCLLPNHAGTVDYVVLCGSELLGHYITSPYYQDFCAAIQRAYQETCARTDDFAQVEAALRQVVNANLNKEGFHHVLTELAFLQIRYGHPKGEHGIIPILLNSTAQQCLPKFIVDSTTIRIEDSIWRTPNLWDGRQRYQDEGLHIGFFKLLKRLLVKQEQCIALVGEKIYEACLQKLREDQSHTLTAVEFFRFLDQSCVTALDALKKDHAADLREQSVQKAQENILTAIQQIQGEALVAPDQLQSALAESYSKRLIIQRVSGEEALLNNCYINLAIVESQAQREKDKEELEKQAKTFERLPSDERLEATNLNKLIPLERLFETQKLRDGSEAIPKRILIQGRAGIGKTTLCKKLVYEYHHNKRWQDRFDCVLWVPLRQLKVSSPQRFEDLLCNQYFRSHEKSRAKALAKAFYAHRDKTLFILDGLDEMISALDDRSPLKGFLEELLNQKHVVITSRPAGVDTQLLGELDLELETVGFSKENVQEYIEKFAPELNQTAIQQFIDRTPLIQGLVNIPIQLDALCYSWDSLPKDQETVTMAMLYEAMVDKLWRKDSVRLEKKEIETPVIDGLSEEDLEELMTAEIDYLGYLAFKGLEAEKIEFSREELSQRRKELNGSAQTGRKLPLNFTTNLKKTSYLHTADAKRPEAERHYHFLHLTFQEFFAAKFLVRHLQAESKIAKTDLGLILSQEMLQTFIAEHKYNPRYEIVWWLVAGLLKGTALEAFFALLEKSPRDLIGIRHQQVIMGCLNEAHTQLDKTIVDRLEAELMQWLQFEMRFSEYSESKLGCQRAFPEHLLLTSLRQNEVEKKKIIRTLGARSVLSEASVQALVGALQDQDWAVRTAAAHALESQKILSEASIQDLVSALQQHENEMVRSAIAIALGGQVTRSGAVAQALISALQDQKRVVRSAAVRALGSQATLPQSSVQALIDVLQDQDRYVRDAAARALENQKTLSGAAAQVLIDALQHKNEYVKSVAVRALGGQATLSEAAIQILIGALRHQNKYVRFAAARALGGQATTLSEAAVQALIGACQDQDEDVRSAVKRALGGQATLSEAGIQALVTALQDEHEDVRDAALEKQKTQPEAAVQALIGALQDENWDVRSAAAHALGGALSETAVQALIGACQDQDEDVRSAVKRALGGQATLSEAGIQALVTALQDEHEDVRDAALEKQKTQPEAAVQALIGALQDENWDVRSAAAHALGGALSETAVQALIGALQDKNWYVRFSAARALEGQSSLSEAAVLALIGACQDENRDVRSAAARALEGQSSLSEAAVLALIGACQDENRDVRSAAARALEGQSSLSEAAVQALIGACQDENRDVRDAAARALEGQSSLSEAAALALIGACQHGNEDVRDAAARALKGRSALSEAAALAFIRACQDENKAVRTAAARALEGRSALSEAVVRAFIRACQDENEAVRTAAARALEGRSALSEAVVRALIGALRNQDEDVEPETTGALKLNINQLYTVLPALEAKQIQMLYREVLFGYSRAHIAPLYVQGNQLHFYTKTGPGHTEGIKAEKMEKIIQAFKAVQMQRGSVSRLQEAGRKIRILGLNKRESTERSARHLRAFGYEIWECAIQKNPL